LPVRYGNAVEGANVLLGADAVLPWMDLQLPDRRPVGRVPIGYAERHHHPWQLLLDGPLPLHDHGRARVHLLRSHLLLGTQDDGSAFQRAPGQSSLLADVRGVQLDVPGAVRDGHEGAAQARERVRAEPSRAERLGLDLGLRARLLDADLPLQHRLLADLRPPSRRAEPVALEVDRVADTHAGACPQLRADPCVRLRSLSLRRAACAGSGTARVGWSLTMAAASENVPTGRMVPPVPLGNEIPPEPPDVGARALLVASRLLAGASTFFFLAFLFTYFYLRSINQEHLWRPPHINPDQALGAAMIACVIVSATLTTMGARQMKGRSSGWLGPAIGGVAFGLAAVGLQCIEYTAQHFGPADGAYASVFCAWTGLY